MKYKGQLRGKFFKTIGFNGCLLIVFLLIVGISVYVQYVKENTVVATVQSITTQQNVSELYAERDKEINAFDKETLTNKEG